MNDAEAKLVKAKELLAEVLGKLEDAQVALRGEKS